MNNNFTLFKTSGEISGGLEKRISSESASFCDSLKYSISHLGLIFNLFAPHFPSFTIIAKRCLQGMPVKVSSLQSQLNRLL